MLKVGVQTKGILPDMPVDKGFQFIKDAGFEKVDLSIDTFLKNAKSASRPGSTTICRFWIPRWQRESFWSAC